MTCHSSDDGVEASVYEHTPGDTMQGSITGKNAEPKSALTLSILVIRGTVVAMSF